MKKVLFALIVALLAVLPAADLAACSTFKLQKGNELLYGHNLNNNGSDIPGMIFVNKRGFSRPDAPGASWRPGRRAILRPCAGSRATVR